LEAGLKDKLSNDLKQALRDGNKVKLLVIRMVLAEVKNAESARQEKLLKEFLLNQLPEAEKSEAIRQKKALSELLLMRQISEADVARITGQSTLGNVDIIAVIAEQAKRRGDSIAAYNQANRPDLVAKEEEELAILRTYLPQQASRDDIIAEVKKVIAEVNAQGPRDKGKVMPRVIAQLKGRADGREINEVVTELLK
jgi:uncharacterized protein YqeY